MTVEDRLGHGLLADGWHSGAVGVWMSGGMWLTLPRPGRERLAVPPALHATWTGTRWQAAKRRGSRRPGIDDGRPHWRSSRPNVLVTTNPTPGAVFKDPVGDHKGRSGQQ